MRILLTSILLASACLAPVYWVTAQTASTASQASATDEAKLKQVQQEVLAELKAKAGSGDQKAAAEYQYTKMRFAPTMDEKRAEKAALQILANGGNAHAVEMLRQHEIAKAALQPNATIDQKLAGARSAAVLHDRPNSFFLIGAVKDDSNASAAQLIAAAQITKDWGYSADAVKILDHPNAVNDPVAIGFKGYLLMGDNDPSNDAAAEVLIRQAAASGDTKSISAIARIDVQRPAKAETDTKAAKALLARAEEGLYVANLELAQAYYTGNMPGIPKDITKAREKAKYATGAPNETKQWESEMLLGKIEEELGNTKDAYYAYKAADSGYNLDIDMRNRASERLDHMAQQYRSHLKNARAFLTGTFPAKSIDIKQAKSFAEKAVITYSDDGFSQAYLLLGQITELEKNYPEAYAHYVASAGYTDGEYQAEALNSIIRLEKGQIAKSDRTNENWDKLKQARLGAGLPDVSGDALWAAYKKGSSSSSSTSSSIASTSDMPSEVSEAIAAFNAELDKAQKRFDLAGELKVTALSQYEKIYENEWGADTVAGNQVCTMFKTTIALSKASTYYLNRAYEEASRIPSSYPARDQAYKEIADAKGYIAASDQDANRFGNRNGCWSGDYSGPGDPFYRNGL